ncbi:MAG: sigma-70 family RNA polymerase sigma factor [Chitinophagales bacterium]|nr:sigma-70 family RNA polymerase sigma factor [Chitinophagales bacterium]
MTKQKEQAVQQAFKKEQKRLLSFIRNRAPQADAEDIMMDVFYQFTASFMVEPIEQVAAWLFRAARNRIIDVYRKKKPEYLEDYLGTDEDDEGLSLLNIVYEAGNNPEDQYFRAMVWEELYLALEELPVEQKTVFVMHELEDKSFKEIAESTGVPLNTLLSRKRYAVLYLRERLKHLYDEFLNK